MPLVKEPKCYGAANLIACTWSLLSCGISDPGPISGSAPAYAYVATAGALRTYSIDSSTGALVASRSSPLRFPVSWPFGGIQQVATDSTGQVLYLTHYSGVHAYKINRNDGALAEVAGSPFGDGSSSLVFDASGTHAYVAGQASHIARMSTWITAYSVKSSGALKPLARYPVSPRLITLVRRGNHLYVAGEDTNSVTVFSIGPSGELIQNVPGSPFATDTGPYSIDVDPSGSVLYTANYGVPTTRAAMPGSISAFTIDSATGALTPVAGNPMSIAAAGPISIDPMGRFLFVPEANGVSVYAINTQTGGLSVVGGSPFTAGRHPRVVSIDPPKRIVYVVNAGSGNVSEFTLGTEGALTPLAGSPVAVGTDPRAMAVVWQQSNGGH